MKILFRNADVFDGWNPELRNCDVLVEGGSIREVSESRLHAGSDTDIVDCGGRTLMPGMIDAHVHVYAATFELPCKWPGTYLAHHAARFLRAALDRGFTTVRDTGGADVGLACALRDGLISGPRLYYGGRVVTQTGGAADMRPVDHDFTDEVMCGCACYHDAFAVVADGTDSLLRAVREEFRRGAAHIKIMLSGSVVSPHASVNHSEYSDDEVLTIVREATRAGKYVAAHCHTAEAIARAAILGVRSIEHGTQIDGETAAVVAKQGAFVVPTLAIMFAMLDDYERLGLPPAYMDKLKRIVDSAVPGLETMKRAGVKMGLGTDLLGTLYTRQTSELALRARVLSPLDILRSTCAVNAELLGQKGRLGCVKPGAAADLLITEGDPLSDISVLCGSGERLAAIMVDGRFHKRTI